MGSSRVGAVFERREREQKRSGGEGGGSANILVRRIKCSVAFACSFLLRNHWRLLQHLDRRSQAEQSKIAGIDTFAFASQPGFGQPLTALMVHTDMNESA